LVAKRAINVLKNGAKSETTHITSSESIFRSWKIKTNFRNEKAEPPIMVHKRDNMTHNVGSCWNSKLSQGSKVI
jgi:hypothetical protein